MLTQFEEAKIILASIFCACKSPTPQDTSQCQLFDKVVVWIAISCKLIAFLLYKCNKLLKEKLAVSRTQAV